MTPVDAPERATPQEVTFDDALQMAVRMHREQQLEGATELYRRLLQAAPGHPDVLHLLGMALHQMGRSDDGVSHIREAIAAQPSFPGFHNNLGNILMLKGKLAEAAEAYEQARALTPDEPDLLSNLGALYKAMRRFDEARAVLERAIAIDARHINAHNNMGLLYAELGDRPNAVDYYVRSLELMPGHAQARKLLGSTYYALGRIQEAAEVYRQWLAIEPNQPMARHMYAACTGEAVPERAQDDYVEQTFDGFAASFESVLNERLEYQAPQLCGALLAELLPQPARQFVMLDAGAGTGLCGPMMAPWARTLAGVDLSKGMLDIAQTKGVYHDLYKAELTDDSLTMLSTITSLESLALMEAKLSVAALAKLKALPKLKRLTLDSCIFSDSDLAALKKELPKVDVRWNPPTDAIKQRIEALAQSATK